MQLVPINLPSLLYIVEHMREWDRREIFATRWSDDEAEYAESIFETCRGYGWIAQVESVPVAFVGGAPTYPNVWSVGMFATDDFPKIGLPFTRFVRNHFIRGLVESGAIRAECKSMEGHEAAHRWLEALGAEREAKHLEYGKNGETFFTYCWTKRSPAFPFYSRQEA